MGQGSSMALWLALWSTAIDSDVDAPNVDASNVDAPNVDAPLEDRDISSSRPILREIGPQFGLEV